MRVYIAGPMTGYEAYNFPAFAAAADRWRALGHDVITPPEITERVWNEHHGRSYNPYTDRAEWGDPVTCELFKRDLAAVCEVDALALLSGWDRSRGAKLEVSVALTIGKPLFCAETFARISVQPRLTLEWHHTDEQAPHAAERRGTRDREEGGEEMTETPRYANGQPVGYSNRGLCEKCAGDLGDCHCPPPPADAALLREVAEEYANAASLRFDQVMHDKYSLTAARLRALAAWVTKAEERLTWMAHFADDPAGMANARTLHYDLTGEARQLLAELRGT